MVKKEYAIELDEHENCVGIYKCKMLEQGEVDDLKKEVAKNKAKLKKERLEFREKIDNLDALVQALLHEIKVLKGEEE